jgi:hypothetical protein
MRGPGSSSTPYMGDRYGSEYWTYTLPRPVRPKRALELTLSCQPIGHAAAHPLPARAAMSDLGHDEKNSRRAYLVCIASVTGISVCGRAGPGRANSGSSGWHTNPTVL